MNSVNFNGRMTRDVELRKTENGKSVVNFVVAVNRIYKVEGYPEADFINCVAWEGVADRIAKYTAKGRLVGISGRLQSRVREYDDGKKEYILEVVVLEVEFLDKKPEKIKDYVEQF